MQKNKKKTKKQKRLSESCRKQSNINFMLLVSKDNKFLSDASIVL